MLAIIFANGEFAEPPNLQLLLSKAELIIAADGGAQHFSRLGIQPHVLIGDFDSVSDTVRREMEENGVRVLAFSARKDQTDLELAFAHAIEAGANKIAVIAGLGFRWDHSLANLLLAAQTQFAGTQVSFLYANQRLHILRGDNQLEAKANERVSLIPLANDAVGITTIGLEYPLHDETLHFGSSRGVSNIVLEQGAQVNIRSGVVLCVISTQDFD